MGLKASPSLAHYVAAKHGVVGLMRSLALELAADNTGVNTVNPTTVNTDLLQNAPTYELFAPRPRSRGPHTRGHRVAVQDPQCPGQPLGRTARRRGRGPLARVRRSPQRDRHHPASRRRHAAEVARQRPRATLPGGEGEPLVTGRFRLSTSAATPSHARRRD
jgi:NAD(P)-dependent dehydrogenase (short-subunit alcohol dehydrogenase family)